MLKILIITARADFGGGPEHIYQLIQYSKDISFAVACPEDYPYWQRYQQFSNVNLISIPHRKFTWKALWRLLNIVHEAQIDLIHTHGKGAGLYGRMLSLLTGKPCVHTPHGIHVGQYNFLQKKLYLLYENITGRLIKKIIYVSSSEGEMAKALKLWRKVDHCIIYNGVDGTFQSETKSQVRTSMRQKLLLDDQAFVVASISRFDYPKNMLEAYRIAKNCEKAIFLWLGDGEDREKLQKLAQVDGAKNILFTGFVENPLDYLAMSDCYLSTSRWEGLPLGVLQAMAVGLPVIASDVVGNRDVVVHGETGFLYPLGVVEQAATYINQVRQDRLLYKALSDNAIQRQRQKFTSERMANEIYTQYQSILNPS